MKKGIIIAVVIIILLALGWYLWDKKKKKDAAKAEINGLTPAANASPEVKIVPTQTIKPHTGTFTAPLKNNGDTTGITGKDSGIPTLRAIGDGTFEQVFVPVKG